MEINNFREAFERGDDPTADMTDASDINSVAGVLKLYLRSSLFLLPSITSAWFSGVSSSS